MATPHLSSPSKPSTPATCQPAPPPKHPGERLADFFDSFFKTVTAISTLGASITFNKVAVTPIQPARNNGFSADQLQYYIADAFVCFALDLFITTLAASALSMWRPQAISYFGTDDSHQRRIVMWWATLVSSVLLGLLIAAFIFLGLVVAGFTGSAGWVALGFTVLMGLVVMGVIVWQSPIGSPPPHPHRRREGHRLRKPAPRYGSYHSSNGQADDEFVVGEYVSEEKISVFDDDGRREEYRFEEEARQTGYMDAGRQAGYVDGGGYRDARAYAEEPLSRSSTIARPGIAAVPPYTEDLRRMRQIRASEEYDGRYGN